MIIPPSERTWSHRFFQVSMYVKGFDGVVETLSGIVLLFVSNDQIYNIAHRLTAHELLQDPDDKWANMLLIGAQHLSITGKQMAALYLLAHGLVKLFMVVQLLREKLWAFPVALGLMGVLVCLQLTRVLYHFSGVVLGATILDVIIMGLVWHEYQKRSEDVRKGYISAD